MKFRIVTEYVTYKNASIILENMGRYQCGSCHESIWDPAAYDRYVAAQSKVIQMSETDGG